MKTLVFVLLVTLAVSFNVRPSHDYWYSAGRKVVETGAPYVDVAWNYCDLKCLSLEKLYPGYDFFVIYFKDATIYKPDFAVCYVQPAVTGQAQVGGVTVGTSAQLWNTVAKNDFYEKNCGSDSEDYLKNTNGYKEQKRDGVGLGVQITY